MIKPREYYLQNYNSTLLARNNKEKLIKKNKCFNCLKPDIRFDEKHDMIYCRNCGIVIKQSLHDFTPPENINYTLLSDISFI